LDNAKRLAPNLVETQIADGYYRYRIEHDYEGAKALFEAVRRSYPNNDQATSILAAIARRQSRWEESRRRFAEAIEINPQDIYLLTVAVETDIGMRDAAAAQKKLFRAHDLSPQNSSVIADQATAFQLSGDIAAAQAILARVTPARGD